MGLLQNETFQRWVGGGWLGRFGVGMAAWVEMQLMGSHKDPETVKLLRETRKKRQSLQTAYEQYLIHTLSNGCAVLPGAMAEVGVFQGCSAKLICETRGDKNLYLFDTFEGLPTRSKADRNVHEKGQYAASLEVVQDFLKDYEDVHYYKGIFPDSLAEGPALKDEKFCFAHFDVDLYDGTLACLEYFYPRMVAAGVMLSHDYSLLSGVKQAFQEYFADKPEQIIELPTTQCMIIKQ